MHPFSSHHDQDEYGLVTVDIKAKHPFCQKEKRIDGNGKQQVQQQ